jgi:ankyrin repeat protein
MNAPRASGERRISELSQTPLINAARRGEVGAVRLLLQRGALPNVRTVDETALHAAAARGHSEAVWSLLEAGANVNARLGLVATEDASLAAAARGHATVVWFLYLAGARVEPRDLCAAVVREYPDLVAKYIAIGLNPHIRDCSGLSALERARRLPPSSRREQIVRILTSVRGSESREP